LKVFEVFYTFVILDPKTSASGGSLIPSQKKKIIKNKISDITLCRKEEGIRASILLNELKSDS
jgi:hypothetical protein